MEKECEEFTEMNVIQREEPNSIDKTERKCSCGEQPTVIEFIWVSYYSFLFKVSSDTLFKLEG